MQKEVIPIRKRRKMHLTPIPWMMDGCFGASPGVSKDPEHGYGLVKGSETKPHITKDELIREIQNDQNSKIQLCWTPEHANLVTPEEVPDLHAALLERKKLSAKNPLAIFVAIIFSLLYGWILVLGVRDALEEGVNKFVEKLQDTGLQYMTVLWFLFGLFPLVQSWWNSRQVQRMKIVKIRAEISDSRFRVWLARNPAPWTKSLIICIVSVGILQFFSGRESSVMSAGLVKNLVWAGEWWRLLTAPLLHVTFLHIYMNLTALYGLGKIVEITTHRTYLLVVFLVAALSGSVFSLFLLPDKTSVGASGGIMGLLGFLIAFGYSHRRIFPGEYLKALFSNVVYIAVIGVVGINFIDNAAHFGGLLMGIGLGFIVAERAQGIPQSTSLSLYILAIIAGAVAVIFTGIAIVKIFVGFST